MSEKGLLSPQLCGTHAKIKTELPKNPNAAVIKQDKLAQELLAVNQVAAANYAEANYAAYRPGSVIVTKLKMMKPAEDHTGYLKVFPNYRHGGRNDGFGCPSLSPMGLGPVQHGECNFPPANNIETYYQQSKCYPQETLPGQPTGQPTKPAPSFYQRRYEMFLSDNHDRHKFTPGEKPLYSVFFDANGVEQHYSYVASRQFYCRAYQKLAIETFDFKRLRELVLVGFNLQICGYDGFEVGSGLAESNLSLAETIKRHYLDPSRPFGHELVLFTLLMLPAEDWPWPKEMTAGDMA